MDIFYQIFITPIIILINEIFILLVSFLGSYGWSIILLSLVVKIILLPVSIYADKLKIKELLIQQKIQPEIHALKKQYKGEELHNKTTFLYKDFNYHPIYALKTSLGLFIQVPFLIAAFLYFGSHEKLSMESFYLIQNLAEPDRALLLGGTTINIMPLIMTLISFCATYLYGRRYQSAQTRELYIIALVFLLLLYNEPSSLLLYWTTNNAFSFIESLR